MDVRKSVALCEELRKLVDRGPAPIARGEEVGRVSAIVNQLEFATGDPYIREKASNVRGDFEIWFSPRRWQQWGSDGSGMRRILLGDILKLEGAIQSLNQRQRLLETPERP